MRTIGVSPMEALVLPRVFATVLMMPLLAFYAAMVAIIGGGIFCWISLEIPPVTFIQRIREVVPLSDLWQLLIKAPVFGLIISLAGCFQGMQVKSDAEEVDAMRTIGVSPMEALVLPRVFATVMMMPLLSFYAAIIAIVGGGMFCWVGLDIPPVTFVQRIREVVPITDLWQLLVKAPVFGLIIALAGCYQGMQVEASAEEVGLRTTTAVVQGIFLVIVLDAFFAVFFTEVGWL